MFLPWTEDDTTNSIDEVRTSLKDLTLSAYDDLMTPTEAWKMIADDAKPDEILLVDTHGHPHLQRGVQYVSETTRATEYSTAKGVISLTCAVSPLDWKDTLEYASQSPTILPALGIHPWYIGDIIVDKEYTSSHGDDIEKYLRWDWLNELETHLSQHPHLIVGEIGLCKMARFVREFPKEFGGKATALRLQKLVFRKQMELAAKFSRSVSVHCVNAHGLFMEVLRDILNEANDDCIGIDTADKSLMNKRLRGVFPPAIAMHSFTGTAHHVQEILSFEKEILNQEGAKRQRNQKKQHMEESSNKQDGLFYFGFSHAVNHVMCTSDKARRKGTEAVCVVPSDRLLVESDVHASEDVVLGTAGAVAYVASARGEAVKEVAEHTTRNGLRFLVS